MSAFTEALELLNQRNVEVPIDSKGNLLCPICGFDYMHPIGVYVNPAGRGGGPLKVTQTGISTDNTRTPAGRGVRVSVEFACESGHISELEFQFHKGNTEVRWNKLKLKEWRTIWRD